MTEENINKLIYIKRVTCPIYLEEIKELNYATKEMEEAAIVWYDGIFRSDKYIDISPSKYLNKIPGMNEICYKYNLYTRLIKMAMEYPYYKRYIPDTFLIPDDDEKFRKLFKKGTTWIMKPGCGYGGKGIEIFQDQICEFPKKAVIQKYIAPYLIEGHKFDLRLHILIASIRPLKVYICSEGIARFCSEKYKQPNSENLHNKYQHLTNSSLNCKNTNGFKFIRPASEILSYITNGKSKNLWNEIKKLSAFTIFALKDEIIKKIDDSCDGEEDIYNDSCKPIDKYNRFFHLLGIDILISDEKKPYILELNDNPAMKNFNDKDEEIKRETVKSEIKFITSLLFSKDNISQESKSGNYNWDELFKFE